MDGSALETAKDCPLCRKLINSHCIHGALPDWGGAGKQTAHQPSLLTPLQKFLSKLSHRDLKITSCTRPCPQEAFSRKTLGISGEGCVQDWGAVC